MAVQPAVSPFGSACPGHPALVFALSIGAMLVSCASSADETTEHPNPI